MTRRKVRKVIPHFHDFSSSFALSLPLENIISSTFFVNESEKFTSVILAMSNRDTAFFGATMIPKIWQANCFGQAYSLTSMMLTRRVNYHTYLKVNL